MKYIIDTHIFLWLIFSPEKIDEKKLNFLKDSKNSILVSNISFWEIALKYALGKLELQGLDPDKLLDVASQMGIEIYSVDAKSMMSVYKLQKMEDHKDPFDRLVIWDCILHTHILVSHDTKFKQYESIGLTII